MPSATIVERQWGDRSMTFSVEVNGNTANWTLKVEGDNGISYATGPTTCTIGNNQVYYKARAGKSTRTFPNVVGSTSGALNISAGTYTCTFSTAIWDGEASLVTKTFKINVGEGGGAPSSYAAQVTAMGGQLGDRASLTVQAYRATASGGGVVRVYDYVVLAYISAGGEKYSLFNGGQTLDNGETKTIPYTIPTALMASLPESSTRGQAEIEVETYIRHETEEETFDDLVGSNFCTVNVSIKDQTPLDIDNVSVEVYTPPEYMDEGKEYVRGDLVTRNNIIYICSYNTSGAWDSSKWTVYTLPDIALANRTLFKVSWEGATASAGSYISDVSVSYNNGRITKRSDNPSENGYIITDIVPQSGNVEFIINFQDARGFRGMGSATHTLEFYEKPQITEFIAGRWNNTENKADEKGTYVHAGGQFSVSSLGGRNQITNSTISNALASETNTFYVVRSGVASGNFYTFRYYNGSTYEDFGTSTSYLIKLSVTDTLNMTTEKIVLISTEPAIMDFKYNGKGLAIGKVAETDNLFEIAMDMEANNGASQMSVKSDTIWLGTAGGESAAQADGLLVDTNLGTLSVKSDAAPMLYKQIRNIFISSDPPYPLSGDGSPGENGDIWIKIGGGS